MSEIVYRPYEYGTADHKKALVLRAVVLEVGNGISDWCLETIYGENPEDREQFMLGAFEGSNLVGTVNLQIISNRRLMLRRMAVAPAMRGRGVGRALLALADETASANGYAEIELHSRLSAVGFYEKSGYRLNGERYDYPGLSLAGMMKTLA